MKVQPVTSPLQVAQTGVNMQAQADARARAIAKMSSPATQASQIPPVNPSNISPEEIKAVKAPEAKQEAKEVTTQSNTVTPDEGPNRPKEEKPPRDENMAKQYAMLAKRERALREQARKQQEAQKQQAEAWQVKEAELNAKLQSYEKDYISKQALQESTLETLTEVGVPYDKVVQDALTQTEINPQVKAYIKRLEARTNKLEAALESNQKMAQETQAQQYQAALKQIEMDTRSLISTDPTYEAIRKTNRTKDVVDLIAKTFDEEGRVMTVQEAADEVENFLVDRLSKQATQIDKVKKRLNLGASQPKSSATEQKPDSKEQTQPMKTLTNANSSTRQLSARERAILAFKGELKS